MDNNETTKKLPRVFVTGDKHGDFVSLKDYDYVKNFCEFFETTRDDVMIVLGDHGTTYYGPNDRRTKRDLNRLKKLPITFVMIRGNHDQRPTHYYDKLALSWVKTPALSGWFYAYDDPDSNVFYTQEYAWYNFAGHNTFVIGGAYSVDKYYRIEKAEAGFKDYRWFDDEQLSLKEMVQAEYIYSTCADDNHIIMSHTCPMSYQPREKLLPGITHEVDHSMEDWLDKIEKQKKYENWYCGHYHTDQIQDRIRFMYHDIIEIRPRTTKTEE